MASAKTSSPILQDLKTNVGDEEKVKYLLSQWIETPKVKVFWEKKNQFDKPIFECDTQDKPDLLVLHPNGPIAIETKYADSISNVLDGITQILRYSQDRSILYADNKEIIAKDYVLATQFSLRGHLFHTEEGEVPRSEGKDYAARMGEIPQREYELTHLALRLLWRFGDFHRKCYGWSWDVGLGFLLSSALNRPDEPILLPMIQGKIDNQQFYREL